ncbi:MAG: type II toxin-antitoxin system PemK/MazF family toxin [Akkermansiaceae bacterium]
MTKPGEVYRVDLGLGGKVRMMMVVSRYDVSAPRALSLCVPITSAYRESDYEVALPTMPFLTMKSFANVQGLQAIQDHELQDKVGLFYGVVLDDVKAALRYALDLK